MNIKDISTQLMYTTTPIIVEKNDSTFSTGTGFIFLYKYNNELSIPLLITNYHVVKNAVRGSFELHVEENKLPTQETISVQFDSSVVDESKIDQLDLVAIPIGYAIKALNQQSKKIFFRTIGKELIPTEEEIKGLAAVEDIVFIGYPNGIYDNINKMSIVRKGITATPIWNDFKGKSEFLIDAGVFPGSSGSPVFILNRGTFQDGDKIVVGDRLLFVGILYGTMINNGIGGNNSYLDLGTVIKSNIFNKQLEKYIENKKLISTIK